MRGTQHASVVQAIANGDYSITRDAKSFFQVKQHIVLAKPVYLTARGMRQQRGNSEMTRGYAAAKPHEISDAKIGMYSPPDNLGNDAIAVSHNAYGEAELSQTCHRFSSAWRQLDFPGYLLEGRFRGSSEDLRDVRRALLCSHVRVVEPFPEVNLFVASLREFDDEAASQQSAVHIEDGEALRLEQRFRFRV